MTRDKVASLPEIIGRSQAHRQILQLLRKVAATDAEVIITGPTGVGKELYAHFVHQQSPRRGGAFVPVNCGALPNDLLENELFGHVGGAFTGARPQNSGLVEAAERGTLFLDEIDSLCVAVQVKLLRFLQEKEYRRLGETRIRRADVRVISASNADLEQAVQEGRFREDLFFRLRVIPVRVPPLRERPDDIPALITCYVERFAEQYGMSKIELSREALSRLAGYPWPGNIRELENCIRYLTCLQLDRPVGPDDLPLLGSGGQGTTNGSHDITQRPLREAKTELVDRFEKDYLEQALRSSDGNIAQAARASGKARRAFFELMRKHGIDGADYKPDRPEPGPRTVAARNGR